MRGRRNDGRTDDGGGGDGHLMVEGDGKEKRVELEGMEEKRMR